MSVASVFLLTGSLLGTFLVQHPFITYPLSLWLFASRRDVQVYDCCTLDRPAVAICMSAYNEQDIIAAKIESLLAIVRNYGPATVHVYVDGASDDTANILARYGAQIDLVVSRERRGKTYGLSVLVGRSDSDLVLFTDANVTASPDILSQLAAPFADPGIGGTSARLVYSNPDESPTARLGASYWTLEEKIKQIESDTIGLVGVDGALFMIRRSLYKAPPLYLIDDLYLSLSIFMSGARLITVRDAVVHERSAVSSGEEFQRKTRIACQAMNVHRALWSSLRQSPAPIVYGYLSHRFLKWIIPFSLLGSVLCALAALAIILGALPTFLGVLAIICTLALGGCLRVRPAMLMISSGMSLAGVAKGVLQALSGQHTYTVWAPAASIRVPDGLEGDD